MIWFDENLKAIRLQRVKFFDAWLYYRQFVDEGKINKKIIDNVYKSLIASFRPLLAH